MKMKIQTLNELKTGLLATIPMLLLMLMFFFHPLNLYGQMPIVKEWTEFDSQDYCEYEESCFARQCIDNKAIYGNHEQRVTKLDSMKVWTSTSAELTESLTQASGSFRNSEENLSTLIGDNFDNTNDFPHRDIEAFEVLKSSKLCGNIYLLKSEESASDLNMLARIKNEQRRMQAVEVVTGKNLVHRRNLDEKISFAYSIYRFHHFDQKRNYYLDQKTLLDFHVLDLEPRKNLTVDICDKKIAKYDRKIRELDLKPEEYFNYKTPSAQIFVNKQIGTVSEEDVIKILDERLADYLHNIALERFEVNTKLARAINNPKVERYLSQVAKEVFENDEEDPVIRINKFMGLFPSLEYSIANDPSTDMKPLLCRHVKKAHKLSRIRRRLRNAVIPISLVTTCTFAPGIGAGVVYGMLIAGGIVSISSGLAEAWLTWQVMQNRVHIKKPNKILYKLYMKTNKIVNDLKDKADQFEKLSLHDQKDLQYILKMEEDMDMLRTNEVKQLYREGLINKYHMVVAAGKIISGPFNFVGGAAVVLGRILTPLLVRRPV